MDDNNTQDNQTPEVKQETPKPSFAFYTHKEAGMTETDPNKISAAPRPMPGMTFTPTGGSVSNHSHVTNDDKDNPDEESDIAQLPQQQQ
jgi:hypothetical protein